MDDNAREVDQERWERCGQILDAMCKLVGKGLTIEDVLDARHFFGLSSYTLKGLNNESADTEGKRIEKL